MPKGRDHRLDLRKRGGGVATPLHFGDAIDCNFNFIGLSIIFERFIRPMFLNHFEGFFCAELSDVSCTNKKPFFLQHRSNCIHPSILYDGIIFLRLTEFFFILLKEPRIRMLSIRSLCVHCNIITCVVFQLCKFKFGSLYSRPPKIDSLGWGGVYFTRK